MTTFRWTIKRKLLALGAVALVPLLLLLGAWTWLAFHEHLRSAEREVAIVSRQGAGQVEGLVEVATRTLEVLALDPDIERRALPLLAAPFAAIQSRNPDVDNVIAVDAEGWVFASGVPLAAGDSVRVADRQWFREVLATGRVTVSGYQVGRITGKPGVVVAVPVGHDSARPKAVLAIALNLDWLARLFGTLPLGRDVAMTVLDGDQRVLAHFPGGASRPGAAADSGTSPQDASAIGRVADAGGDRHIVAVSPVKRTRWRIVVAISRASVYGRIARSVVPIAVPLLGILVVAYIAALLVTRGVWRPIHALTEAARRLPDEDVPGPLPVHATDEIGELSRTFTAMADDIRRTRRGLERRVAEATAMNEAARLLTGTLELPAVLERLTEIARDRLGADVVRVWVASDAPGVFHLMAQSGGPPDSMRVRVDRGDGLVGWVAKHRSPLLADDLRGDARLKDRDWIERAGVVSFLGVPLVIEGAAVAVMAIMTRQARQFVRDDVALAEAIAIPGAIAIRNARLYEEQVRSKAEAQSLLEITRQRGGQLQLLHEAARALASEHDIAGLLQRLVDTAQALLAARYGALAEFDEDGRIARFLTSGLTDDERRRLDRAAPEGRGLLGHVFSGGDIVRIGDVARHPAATGLPEGHPAMRAFLGAPIRGRERVVGALYVAEKDGGFTAADEDVMTALCADAAVAIDNARLLAAEQQRRAEADVLLEISVLAGTMQDEKDLYRRIALATARACGADRCSIYLWNEREGSVVPVMSQFVDGTRDARMWEAFTGVGKLALDAVPFVREAILRKEPVVVENAADDPRLPPGWAERYQTRHLLAVPLSHHETLLGVLTLTQTRARDAARFTADQVRFATTIAAQVTLSMENARLVKDLRRALDELRRAQDHLIQTETLRALGEMSAGIAHHLNNLLAIVIGRTQLLLMRPIDGDVRRMIEIIERAARDGADVVRRIHGFSRVRPVTRLAPVDLNEVVQEVIELTRPRWSDEAHARGISIDVVVESAPVPRLVGEAAALREVLLNLVLNAADALPDGGRITCRTWRDGGHVCVAVTDTGVGMSEDDRRRVLEPFFTTKGPKSTGLGLSVSYGIVRRHGGELDVESTVGRGTTVSIRLPLGAETDDGPAEPPATGVPVRVLVVDDEPDVLATVVDMLKAQGHDVTAATSAREALGHVEGGATVDVIVSDLGMPDMNGLELALVLKRRWPNLPVVLMTGWGETSSVIADASRVVDLVTGKPVTLAALADAIARVTPVERLRLD